VGDQTLNQKVEKLSMFVIYEHPSDFPGEYVVRRHEMRLDSAVIAIPMEMIGQPQKTLSAARDLVPDGLTCLASDPEDLPCIKEVWV
jgi:hypothetical protein